MDWLGTVLASVGGTTILFAGVGFVLRDLVAAWVKSGVDRDLEGLKAQLKIQGDRELEAIKGAAIKEAEVLKAELSRTSREHDLRFSKFYEERFKVLTDVYEKLRQLQRLLYDVVRDDLSIEDRSKHALDFNSRIKLLNDYLVRHIIFVPRNIARRLIAMVEEMALIIMRVSEQLQLSDSQEQRVELERLKGDVHDRIRSGMTDIDDLVRKILGDEG